MSLQRLAYFKGNCTLFNLESVVRLKGNNLTKVAERWRNEEDYPLVVCLIFEESGAAWMIGHWGYREIFRSSMFLPAYINSISKTTVHVLLRQWTRRRDDPITRHFCLLFGCLAMTEGFVFAHNRFVVHMKEQRAERELIEDVHGSGDEDKSKEVHGEKGSGDDTESGEDKTKEWHEHGQWSKEDAAWLDEAQNTKRPTHAHTKACVCFPSHCLFAGTLCVMMQSNPSQS